MKISVKTSSHFIFHLITDVRFDYICSFIYFIYLNLSFFWELFKFNKYLNIIKILIIKLKEFIIILHSGFKCPASHLKRI